MNKLKKFVMSLLVVFMMAGTFEPTLVSASNNKYNTIPSIQIDTSTGNIKDGLESSADKGKALNKILYEYRGIVTFISGIGMISMIMFFIFNLINLGNSKGNPQERQKAVTGLIVSGIATAGLGSVTLITSLFYNLMSDSQ